MTITQLLRDTLKDTEVNLLGTKDLSTVSAVMFSFSESEIHIALHTVVDGFIPQPVLHHTTYTNSFFGHIQVTLGTIW